MSVAQQTDDEQAKLWNGVAGQGWVETQEMVDALFKPIEEMLVEAAATQSARSVLDVGCGTGGITLAAARRLNNELGEDGNERAHAVGVDISAPMIAAANARLDRETVPMRFICADAQTHPFEPASFDMILSRFGVMFFNDFVEAFANLRRAAKDGAGLCMVAWRSAEENPFMTLAERAVAPLLPDLPPRRSNEQGQFAFAEAPRVQRILEESGWTDIDIQPADIECVMPETDLVRYLTYLGPVGRALQEMDEDARPAVIEMARAAFEPYVHGTEVRFTAACWTIGAQNGAGRD